MTSATERLTASSSSRGWNTSRARRRRPAVWPRTTQGCPQSPISEPRPRLEFGARPRVGFILIRAAKAHAMVRAVINRASPGHLVLLLLLVVAAVAGGLA